MKTLRTSSLALASVVLTAGVSGCGLVLGLGDFTEGKGSGGAGGGGGATASSTGGSGGSGGGTTTTTTTTSTGTGGMEDLCADGKKDQNETDKDCGGVCAPCDDGKGCGNASDCVSHVCSPGGSCSAPTCTDTVKNGTETDVDCGTTCPKCADGLACTTGVDCLSGLCTGGACFSASCGDGTKNGTETDVDCGGGACPGCAPTKVCAVATDCGSGICKASACVDHHIWSKRFGDADFQEGTDVAVDSAGNVTMLGDFMGTIDFGGGPATNPCVDDPATQEPDCAPFKNFLVRLAPDGKHVWSKYFQNKSSYYGYYGTTSAVTDSGDTWILSYGDGSLDFGSGQLADPTSGSVDDDVTLVQLGSSGVYKWGKRLGDSGDQHGLDIAGGVGGVVALTGEFSGNIDFGGGALASAGSYDVFVAKLSSSGSQLWAKRFGESTNEQNGQAVALDSVGNVFVAGKFTVSVNFGGGTLAAAGGNDVFVAKLKSSDGSYLWAKRFGDVTNQVNGNNSVKVATDPAGNVIVAGPLSGSADFGGGVLTSSPTCNLFVAKLDLMGAHLWSKCFGNAGLGGITTDGAGAVILTGTSAGADFGGGPLAGGFLVKLDPSGAHVWSKPYAGKSVAADGSKALLVTGAFGVTQDFGGGPLVSAGSSDVFVAKFVDP